MPIAESEKALQRVRHLLDGVRVLDLGSGMKRIVPWAVGVDDASENTQIQEHHVSCRVDPDARALPEKVGVDWDVVFSSHTVEHMRAPIIETLRYWTSLVKSGGRLILYLPDERRYRYDPQNLRARNPGHWHYLTPDTFRWYLDQVRELIIESLEEDPDIADHYSFLVIARKK